MTTLLWLRRALRLDDNPALRHACDAGRLIIASPERLLPCSPVVSSMMRDMAGHRLDFRRQCLASLASALSHRQHCLLLVENDHIQTLVRLLSLYDIKHLIMDAHPDVEQQQRLERELIRAMPRLRIDAIDCNSLFNALQLGIDANSLPAVFSQFRRCIEKQLPVVESFDAPEVLPAAVVEDEIPSVIDQPDARTTDRFAGGEQAGLEHLYKYLFVDRDVRHYKDTRNGLLHDSDGSRFSVWLADGALSPRRIWTELDRYAAQYGEDKHTSWLRVELFWREFFRWNLMLRGSSSYLRQYSLPPLSVEENQKLQAWQQGRTGIPFIDANMIELQQTGFMSNRGRQNVASFLIHDLQVHWLYGAAWFEQNLLDFDLPSNLGNWAYIAGCGNDPRPHRQFNILRQADQYDPQAKYISHWLPCLAALPLSERHSCFCSPNNPHCAPIIPMPSAWHPYLPQSSDM
ncbi:DASH family cryptochrome [Alcanivorax sp. 1008]|uniref:DASH family cryptochrome n=1 Tax=Alcanivorax sp. 1008 TaxID=2816853 RepID=UPI001E096B93|nr:DASH family cryptochrome [Alcanivorax sp. 1008]